MPKRKRMLKEFLRQDNARGYGLARDVKAGQASETPLSRQRRLARRQGDTMRYRRRRTYRA